MIIIDEFGFEKLERKEVSNALSLLYKVIDGRIFFRSVEHLSQMFMGLHYGSVRAEKRVFAPKIEQHSRTEAPPGINRTGTP